MARSTKILLVILGVVLVAGVGAYFYINRYGTVGADVASSPRYVGVQSCYPVNGSINFYSGFKPLSIDYSSKVSYKITKSDIQITRDVFNNSSNPEDGIIDFDLSFANIGAITGSRVLISPKNLPFESVITVSVNPRNRTVQPFSYKFLTVTKSGVAPEISKLIQNNSDGKIAFQLNKESRYDFKINGKNGEGNYLLDSNLTNDVSGTIDFNYFVYQSTISSSPSSTKWYPERYIKSNYISGIYTGTLTARNFFGASEPKTINVAHIKPVTPLYNTDTREVSATLKDGNGAALSGISIEIVSMIQGSVRYTQNTTTDANGNIKAKINVPDNIVYDNVTIQAFGSAAWLFAHYPGGTRIADITDKELPLFDGYWDLTKTK